MTAKSQSVIVQIGKKRDNHGMDGGDSVLMILCSRENIK